MSADPGLTGGVISTGSVVIPGLVPGIQPTASAGASCEMDPGDKHRDDTVVGQCA
jgi:hypothetical protein